MADEAMDKIMRMGRNEQRPDKHTQRKQWNASWEEDLKDYYKTAMQPRRQPRMASSPELKKLVRDTEQQTLLTQEKTLQAIGQLQKDIVEYASVKHRHQDVIAAWRHLDDATRRETVLAALFNVSLAGPDLEGYRKWCPDMTIGEICANGGQLFLQQLSALIEYWVANPALPMLFPHAAVDRVNQELDIDLMVRNNKISRGYFVSFVIWRVLLELYDDDESYLIGKAPKQTGLNSAVRDLLRAKGKQADGEEFKAMFQELSARYDKSVEDQVKVCWTCGKDATRSKSGGPLKLCHKCNSIGRKVWYCSVECQKEDWKTGTPRPHKMICGRPLEATVLESPTEASEPEFSLSPTSYHTYEIANMDSRAQTSTLPPVGTDAIAEDRSTTPNLALKVMAAAVFVSAAVAAYSVIF